LVEVLWGWRPNDVDDVDALSPNNNVSDKAISDLFIAPLLLLIKMVFEFPDNDAHCRRLRL